jgi:hypothetical protein
MFAYRYSPKLIRSQVDVFIIRYVRKLMFVSPYVPKLMCSLVDNVRMWICSQIDVFVSRYIRKSIHSQVDMFASRYVC